MQKECEKAWHDHHIKLRTFKVNDLVFLFDSKFTKFPGKFQMHCIGPYIVKEIIDGGVVQLSKLNGDPFSGKVNGRGLKLYTGDPMQWLYGGKKVLVLQAVEREHGTIKYTARFGGKHNEQVA